MVYVQHREKEGEKLEFWGNARESSVEFINKLEKLLNNINPALDEKLFLLQTVGTW